MVRIFTNKNLLGDVPIIPSDGAKGYFLFNVGAVGIKKDGVECIYRVDNAEFLPDSRDMLRTPFGITGVGNLSTGCHTVLNLLYVRDNKLNVGVDVTGCGANALDLAFEYADGTGIPLVLRYLSVSQCKSRKFLVNGKHEVTDIFDLIALLEQYLSESEAI